MSLGWSPTGICKRFIQNSSLAWRWSQAFVRPGRSTKVKSSTSGLYIRRDMGSLLMPLFWPATRKVSCSISFLISWKPVNFWSMCRNCPHSRRLFEEPSAGSGVWMSWRTSGLRVTMPCPRGRKSRPTILENSQHNSGANHLVTHVSMTLDLPADWLPTFINVEFRV